MTKERDLLRRARNVFGNCRGDDAEDLFDEICAFLDVEPEAEPFAWVDEERLKARQQGFSAIAVWFNPDEGDIPLYLHPPRPEPARKPMTEEEAIELCPFTREEFKAGFLTGVRFAEKHHGITED